MQVVQGVYSVRTRIVEAPANHPDGRRFGPLPKLPFGGEQVAHAFREEVMRGGERSR